MIYKIFFCMMAAAMLFLGGCDKKQEQPVGATLTITSTPEGAAIYRGDNKLGDTPYTVSNTKPGRYLLRVESPGYQPEWLNLHLDYSTTTNRHVKFLPITGKVMIVSQPSGAKVMIKNELKGVTPLVLQDLPIGSYEAIVEKPGFEPRPISWKIADARPHEISVSMDSNIGRLVVNSTPNRVAVYLNDKLAGHTPFRVDLEEGHYKLKLVANGFAELNRNIMVIKNKEHVEDVSMTELPGILEITSKPGKAEVTINDKAYGSTPLKISELKAGNYTVKVSRDNFDSQVKEIEIVPGQKVDLEFELTKNTSGIDLVVNPPGVTVYLNGKVVATTERGESENLSKMISLRDLNAGDYELTFAHKRAIPDKITRKVTLKKGEVTRLQPVRMWIANAEMKLHGNRPSMVQIISRDSDTIYYSPDPGVTTQVAANKVEYVKMLDNEKTKAD